MCAVMMVMGCHVLPWRETDTHSSLAVKADLPRWGAHDDRHSLPRTMKGKAKNGETKEKSGTKKKLRYYTV